VEFAIKTCSDDVELRQRIPFTFNDSTIKRSGDIVVISTPDDSFKATKSYTLPQSTKAGAELIDTKPNTSTLFDVKSAGASFDVKAIEKKPCYASSGWKRDDGFNQGTNMPVMLTNPKDTPTTLTTVTGEFFINSTWEKANSVEIGLEDGSGRLYYDNVLPLQIKARGAHKITVSINKKIIGDPPAIRGRKHKSLPDPLKIRATLKDVTDKTVTIIYELSNPILDLPTAKTISSALDKKKASLLFFLCVDNIETEERNYSTIVYENGEEYFLKLSSGGGSSRSMGESTLKNLAYAARKAQTEEIICTDFCESSGSRIINYYGLVDLKGTRPILYGFKVEIKVGSSFAIDSFLLYPAIDKAKAEIADNASSK